MTSRRIVIRPPTARDRDAFIEAARRSRSLHRPWVRAPEDKAAFHAWRRSVNGPDHAGFLICAGDDDALAGVANLNHIVRGGLRSAYLGYYAFVPHAGTGCMRAGLARVLSRAFGPLGLHRVEANVQPDNPRSLALVAALGFRREGFSPRYLKIGGRWRDHERWALLAEDRRGGRQR